MKTLRYGIEIELGGYSRENAARIIANYFGTSADFVGGGYDKWRVYDRQGRKWEVMSDASVTAGRQSCEVVSPLLTYDDIEDLQEVVRELRRNGYVADSSCGIHVHVDNSGMTAAQIKNLVNLVSGHEELIYQSLKIRQRGRETWCKKTDCRFKDTLNKKRNLTMSDVKKIWYFTQTGSEDRSRTHYCQSRYHLLNLHSMWQNKGIEFRCFNGTTHAGKIKAYIQFCLALVAKAKTLRCAKTRENNRDDSLRAMKSFLKYLGLNGDEFKTCRLHMTKNLSHEDSVNVRVA